MPDDFQFTLKLSKEVTHAKDLEADLSCMEKFMHSARGTGNKKGCLLVQFPGKISLDHFKQVEEILQELAVHDRGNEWRKAVEFRNTTWFIGEAWELLDEYGAAMVMHDKSKSKMFETKGHADFIYLRLHGPKGDYRDSYSDDFLQTKSEEINEWAEAGKDVYVYFNNTAGNAFENALTLKKILQNYNTDSRGLRFPL